MLLLNIHLKFSWTTGRLFFSDIIELFLYSSFKMLFFIWFWFRKIFDCFNMTINKNKIIIITAFLFFIFKFNFISRFFWRKTFLSYLVLSTTFNYLMSKKVTIFNWKYWIIILKFTTLFLGKLIFEYLIIPQWIEKVLIKFKPHRNEMN